MIAIEVHFLTGRYYAASFYDREQPEWPPHGARLFSAMVAGWAEAAEAAEPGAGPRLESERAALEWLEWQAPPRITAPDAVGRRVVSHFVPVNDAGVVSASQYSKRIRDCEGLIAQWEDALDASGGEITPKVDKLQTRIDTKRNVESLVARAGNTNPESAERLLPSGRLKKERHFPSVTLTGPPRSHSVGDGDESVPSNGGEAVPSVVYSWDVAPEPETLEALDGLLRRVTRLGHSSSLVSCRLRETAPPATHEPGGGPRMLRWIQSGQLEALEAQYQRHRGERPRLLPYRGINYREVTPGVAESTAPAQVPDTAGEWIVFELEPADRKYPTTRTVEFAKVLREALLHYAADPLPEGLSGHIADGRPTTAPHVSFLALPNVGHSEHSDGRILGLAVSLPHGLGAAARNAALVGISRWERSLEEGDRPLRLTLGRRGAVELRRLHDPEFASLLTLRPGLWRRSSRHWTSVTPVALPTHPGELCRGSPAARAKAWARAGAAVLRSCAHIGLAPPVDVQVSLAPYLAGARPVADFATFRQGGTVRRLVHVSLSFASPVAGPLVLGSGRYLGLGLMRPVWPKEASPPLDSADGEPAATAGAAAAAGAAAGRRNGGGR